MHQLVLEHGRLGLEAVLEHDQADRELALELVVDADHGALGHGGVAADQLLHLAGRQAMPGHVDHVVGAAHDEHVAVLIDVAAVGGVVVAVVGLQVAVAKALVVVPQGRQAAGRQRQLEADVALLARRAPAGRRRPAPRP